MPNQKTSLQKIKLAVDENDLCRDYHAPIDSYRPQILEKIS